ncbi:hypothetical protein NQ315_013345 [Exocentrus adspersus]|uniref:Uncharacterized protein n=1 Tax=Exocentrus adspersus TaxID=1586481 RepID=A0AAV8VRD1_9CUCU|nr:hypothetical protein NQ315_013345 [Exocentrus adspersus]
MVIRPITTYASETWVWERKILRKIFEGKRVEEGWIRRTNEEINNLYGEASIVSVVRARRLSWLGHIERLTNVRIPKLLMERTIGGKRRRGRPKARWKAEVEKDLQQLQKKYTYVCTWVEKAIIYLENFSREYLKVHKNIGSNPALLHKAKEGVNALGA